MTGPYPRDLAGYGPEPPDAAWPDGARVAISVVLNWEEGAENNILHGDAASEAAVCDVVDAVPSPGMRDPRVESMFEYGSRAGVWRLRRIAAEHGVPLTVFASGMAVERSPETIGLLAAEGHEISGHGYRWIDYLRVDPMTERDHIARTVRAIERATGRRPVGWYTGRNSANTRRLVVEEGGFGYDSDDYSDDLPHWTEVDGRPHLILPYSLDLNDMRFVVGPGFSTGADFATYLCETFDQLYDEGRAAPRMMSVGLHCRIAGRPGRAAGLARFLEHARAREGVWFATREQIADHWRATHPHPRLLEAIEVA